MNPDSGCIYPSTFILNIHLGSSSSSSLPRSFLTNHSHTVCGSRSTICWCMRFQRRSAKLWIELNFTEKNKLTQIQKEINRGIEAKSREQEEKNNSVSIDVWVNKCPRRTSFGSKKKELMLLSSTHVTKSGLYTYHKYIFIIIIMWVWMCKMHSHSISSQLFFHVGNEISFKTFRRFLWKIENFYVYMPFLEAIFSSFQQKTYNIYIKYIKVLWQQFFHRFGRQSTAKSYPPSHDIRLWHILPLLQPLLYYTKIPDRSLTERNETVGKGTTEPMFSQSRILHSYQKSIFVCPFHTL